MKTISNGLEQPQDNFLLLRFIAAAMVIYGHAPAVAGGWAPRDLFVWLNWGEYSGSIAVDIFFVISGFLVTGSFLRRPHLVSFLWARFLRIVPAYLVLLLLSAFVIGAVFTNASLRDYFSRNQTYVYITDNIRFSAHHLAWRLPEVFSTNPKTTTVNGAIWTLPAEVAMYIWAAMLGVAGIIGRRWLFNAVIAGLFIYGFVYPHDIFLLDIDAYTRMAGLFAAGAFCYVNRSWLPVSAALLMGAIILAYVLRSYAVYPWLFGACEVLFVFWFAYGIPDFGFNRVGDYSYGLYLWGYPSQQMIAAVAPQMSSLMNALCGLATALAIAAISWHVIEKPALRWKGAPAVIAARIGRPAWLQGLMRRLRAQE